MATIVALSKEKHASSFLSELTDLQAYKNQSTLPVYGAEISRLALNFPLAFIKQGDSYGLHILCSYSPDFPNAWITPEGKWLGHYIPAIIRQSPFTVIPNDDGNPIVCVDQDSSRLGDTGNPLFEEGKTTEFLSGIIKFLEQLYLNGIATQKAIDLMASFDLMVPWELKVRTSDEKETTVEGVFRADENKLNELDDEQWLALRKVGAMPLLYGQLLSMGHIAKMQEILQSKINRLSESANAAENLDAFFGEDEDDTLDFGAI
jgi:hypothetical protein